MYVLEDIKSEVKVKLWLKSEGESERVKLIAENTVGESKTLAVFRPDGGIYFPSDAHMAGVTTDDSGRIGKNLNPGF